MADSAFQAFGGSMAVNLEKNIFSEGAKATNKRGLLQKTFGKRGHVYANPSI